MSLSARVQANEPVAPTVRRLTLKILDAGWTFRAGQFVVLLVPPRPEDVKQPKGFYSIASPEYRLPELELLVEQRSDGSYVSAWVGALKPGSQVMLEGPLGHFGLDEGGDEDEAFIGARAGLAPLRSLLLSSLARRGGGRRWLFVGAHSPEELLLDAELRALAQAEARFHYVPCVGVDPAAAAAARLPKDTRIYAAGFTRDLDALKAGLLAAGFAAERLRFEKFG
jgi:CDP-4-dehydro-6-deoxyglucose reductase